MFLDNVNAFSFTAALVRGTRNKKLHANRLVSCPKIGLHKDNVNAYSFTMRNYCFCDQHKKSCSGLGAAL